MISRRVRRPTPKTREDDPGEDRQQHHVLARDGEQVAEAGAPELLARQRVDQVVLAEHEPAGERRLAGRRSPRRAPPRRAARIRSRTPCTPPRAAPVSARSAGSQLEARRRRRSSSAARNGRRGRASRPATGDLGADRQIADRLGGDGDDACRRGCRAGTRTSPKLRRRHGGDVAVDRDRLAGRPRRRAGVDRRDPGVAGAEPERASDRGEGERGRRDRGPRLAPRPATGPADPTSSRGPPRAAARQPARRRREVGSEQQPGGEPGEHRVPPPADARLSGCPRPVRAAGGRSATRSWPGRSPGSRRAPRSRRRRRARRGSR